MKTLTVRLPNALASQIEAESRARRISKSDVVRERLTAITKRERKISPLLEAIQDVIGSVDGLPSNIASNKKAALKALGYGRKRPR
jgi:Arc/MetJ-type ribon-helix-helix transcriptional regulator